MGAEYSLSPHGEKFRLPSRNDYAKEFKDLNEIGSDHRTLGREIVVVQGLGRGNANRIKNRMQKQKEEMLLQIRGKPPLAIHTAQVFS